MTDLLVTLKTICTPSENIVSRMIEGEVLIVPLTSGIGDADDELYSLNETGLSIWNQLDGKRSLAEVVEALQPEFEASHDQLESDVLGWASEMVRRKILVAQDDRG